MVDWLATLQRKGSIKYQILVADCVLVNVTPSRFWLHELGVAVRQWIPILTSMTLKTAVKNVLDNTTQTKRLRPPCYMNNLSSRYDVPDGHRNVAKHNLRDQISSWFYFYAFLESQHETYLVDTQNQGLRHCHAA